MNRISLAYAVFFILFITLYSIHRVHETYFSKKKEIYLDIEIKEKITLKLMTVIHVLVVLGTTIEFFRLNRIINFYIASLGIIMVLIAEIVRKLSIKTLGFYHSYNIVIFKDHKLIRRGIYAYMRHPIYFVTILELLGIPLIGNAYYSLCFAIVFYMPLLVIRTILEERALIYKFGEEYINYKKAVPALFPLIKRRKAEKS